MELVSERCIVSLLDRVVEVKPTYTLLYILEERMNRRKCDRKKEI